MNHVSISPINGIGPTQGQRRTLTRVGIEGCLAHHLMQANKHDQAPVVQTMDSAIRRINRYPLDNSIGFASVYPLDSDLSGG